MKNCPLCTSCFLTFLTSNLANQMKAKSNVLEPDLRKIQSLKSFVCLFVCFFVLLAVVGVGGEEGVGVVFIFLELP